MNLFHFYFDISFQIPIVRMFLSALMLTDNPESCNSPFPVVVMGDGSRALWARCLDFMISSARMMVIHLFILSLSTIT